MIDRGIIRPRVAQMPAFQGVPTADAPGRSDSALLHLNESPFPPSPKVIEAICNAASGLNRYAEARPAKLAEALGTITGRAPETIVIGNGSDEILALIATMALEPGDGAVMPTPSFPRYRIATAIAGASAHLVRIADDGANDIEAMLAAIDDKTRIVFACTPNNPSGAPLSAGALDRLVIGVPDHILLVVDEAYAEFNAFEGGGDALPYLAKRKGPWISTRTFSKAYALAGLRLGYALCSDAAVADGLVKVKCNFNLNRLAVHAGLAALQDAAYSQACIGEVVAERNRIAARIRAKGYSPLSSRANFLSFDVHRNAVPIINTMALEGVLVREWRDPGFETFIRISIGSPEENNRALDALGRALAEPVRSS
jgi:histidinol-phosphate aminotransferase